MLNVTIDPDIEKRLEALGTKTAIRKIDFVRQAMLDALEDLEDAVVADERLMNPGSSMDPFGGISLNIYANASLPMLIPRDSAEP